MKWIALLSLLCLVSCKHRDFGSSNTTAIEATKKTLFGFGGTVKTVVWAIPNEDKTAQCWYEHTVDSNYSPDNEQVAFVRSTPKTMGYANNEAMAKEIMKSETLKDYLYSTISVLASAGAGFVGCGLSTIVLVEKFPTGAPAWENSMAAGIAGMVVGAGCGVVAGGASLKHNFYDKRKVKVIAKDQIKLLLDEDPNYFRKVDYAVVEKLIAAAQAVQDPSNGLCPPPKAVDWNKAQKAFQVRLEKAN